MTWLSALLGLLYGIWQKFFSDPAELKRKQLAEAARLAEERVEAERLKAAYERIQREPDKHGKDLVDDLNKPRP